jgi:HEAT repeat protein
MGEHWFNVIIDLLQALLSDADVRVRSEAVLCMPRLVESVVVGTSKGQQITVLETLLPKAFKIQSDSSPEVRSALATATGDLLIFLVGADDSNDIAPPSPGRGAISTPSLYKKYVDDTLIPILQKLLQDLNPEVTTASLRAVTNASRSSAVGSSTRIPSTSHTYDASDDDVVSLSSHQSLQSHTSFDRRKPVFIPVLSEEQVLRLLPTLSNLATSKEWRVRQSAVEIVPALLGCTYRHETRHEISKFCLRLMS